MSLIQKWESEKLAREDGGEQCEAEKRTCTTASKGLLQIIHCNEEKHKCLQKRCKSKSMKLPYSQ